MPDFEWNKRWGKQAQSFKDGDKYFAQHKIYGYQWGDPLKSSASFVVPEYINGFLTHGGVTLEIGPGGGRYSQFLAKSGKIIFVEYNPEFFSVLRNMFAEKDVLVECVHSENCLIPSVADASIDFMFSFDCFVHLDIHLIESYLSEVRRTLKPSGVGVIHYADKRKALAQEKGSDFADTTPEIMRGLLSKAGLKIKKEDTERISHSAIVAFERA